jgi:tetratricopeptide (TPR) repeat protein
VKGFKQGLDPKKPGIKACPPDTQPVEQALAAYRNGNPEKSKKILEIVLGKTETANNEIFHAFVLGFMATVERALGNKSKALEMYRASTELSSSHADILHNYSSLLAETSPQAALSISAKAVNLAPDNAMYLERHGFIRWKCGDLQGSAKATRRALELNPALLDAHINLGLVLKEQGQLDQALAETLKAIELKPDHADAHINLGGILQEQGKLDQALAATLKAIELTPDHADAHMHLGGILQEQGKLDQALAANLKAIELKPDHADAYMHLGEVLQERGQLSQALASTLKAIELKPDHAVAHMKLGGILKEQGQLDQALAANLKAIELRPDLAEGYIYLGVTHKERKEINKAVAATRKAIELKPNHAIAHVYLGALLQEQGQLDQALALTLKAIELKSDHADTHIALGNIYRERDQIDEAIDAMHQAINLKPGYPEPHKNLSFLYLSKGDYSRGLKEFEWRLKTKRLSMTHARPRCKQWDGRELETDTRLMVVSEQGLGDTLQFMRYCHTLRERGLDISFCAQTKLHGLIKASGIDPSPLTPKQGNSAISDFWIPLLSVPLYLGVSPENPVSQKPYIKTNKSLIDKWRKTLETERKPIIGIHWQGNPEAEKTTLWGRSLPLEAFKSVADQKSLSLLSLQKGFGSEQFENCSFKERFVSCQHEVDQAWDFLETAAVVACCDLIITNDTGLAHLAGGLGKTTWLLLHAVPDWRWGLEGDKSFWYPTMRLFRQSKRDTWDEVMDYVTNELLKEFPQSASVESKK